MRQDKQAADEEWRKAESRTDAIAAKLQAVYETFVSELEQGLTAIKVGRAYAGCMMAADVA